ncbi:hypothetical protein NPA08_02545 [Mycoplasmopsis citelli]|uniref:hypothetical protein n=1 Tax=Mycoplasmopsis citelli TaxID=171281 RepID=UPI00211408CC|nr:hypothetical protein [Mycoplasmopsis citelli]UUD35824.1 hypothetical protein NPA08_02545 [Mycoplasmopsis citelli]
MKNLKKAITTLVIVAGSAGFGTLLSAGLMLSLHSSYKPPYKQTYHFLELENQVLKTQDVLQNYSISQEDSKSNLEVKTLFEELNYAKQLLNIEDSSIAMMLEQRNKLKCCTLKALLSKVEDQETLKNLINEYASLVKEVDYQEQVTQSKDKIINSILFLENKDKALSEFYKSIDPLIEEQHNLSFALETKIWTNYVEHTKNISALANNEQKSALLLVIDQILSLLSKEHYSKDTLLEYEKVYDEIITQLSSQKEQQNKNLNKFLENLVRVKNEISLLQIDKSMKDNFLKRINNYKAIALSKSATLALDKDQEILHLNDAINNELNILTTKKWGFKEIASLIPAQLENLKNLNLNDQIQALINKEIQYILNISKSNEGDVLNALAQASNLQASVKTIQSLIDLINSKIQNYLNDKTFNDEETKLFEQKLSDILSAKYSNVNEYLSNLRMLLEEISDNALVVLMFKNALEKLNEQALLAFDKGFEVDKQLLSWISLQISNLLKNGSSISILNENLRIISIQIREINRLELKNWFDLSLSFTEDQNNNISEQTKDNLLYLNNKASELLKPNSNPTRDEMQFLIAQYKKEFDQSNLDRYFQSILLLQARVKNTVFSNFVDQNGKITSEFGQKLFADVSEYKTKVQMIFKNPNLNPEEKQEKISFITNQLHNIANNTSKFKELERVYLESEKILKSSNFNKSEKEYLKEQSLKLSQIQNNVLNALENNSTINNVDDLITEIKDANENYVQNQAQYQSGQGIEDKIKEINQIFAPYSVNGEPTETQRKILDKLEEYRKELSDVSLSPEQRKEIAEKINNLMQIVDLSKQLEATNNKLKDLSKEDKSQNFGTFKPQTEFDKAKKISSEIDQYLDKVLKGEVTKEQLKAKVADTKNEAKSFEVAISSAHLQKTTKEILDNKITDKNLENQSPFKEINQSIEQINTQTQKLLANPHKNKHQIEELQKEILKYKNLASSLKNVGNKLSSINKTDSPKTYEILLDLIKNKSLIKYGDSPEVINSKIRFLNDALDKVDIRIEAEKNINKLKQAYEAENQKQAISDGQSNSYKEKLQDYESKLKDLDASKYALNELKEEIEFYTQKQQKHQQELSKKLDSIKEQKTKLKNKFEDLKKKAQISNLENVNKIFDEFDKLTNQTDSSGQKVIQIKDLLNQLEKVNLAYEKDLFVKNVDEALQKINQISGYSSELEKEIDTTKIKNNLQKQVDAIKKKILSFENVNDIDQIRNDVYKISAINSYANEVKSVLTYLNSDSSEKTGKKNYQVLQEQGKLNSFKSILNSLDNLTDEQIYQKDVSSILAQSTLLKQEYINNASLEDAKKEQVKQIDEYKKVIEEKFKDVDNDLKNKITAKLDNLKNEAESITDKTKLLKTQQNLQNIQTKVDSLKNLVIKAQEANKLSSPSKDNNSQKQNTSVSNSITTIYNSIKDNFLELSNDEILNKEKLFDQKMDLFEKVNQISNLITQKKALIPSNFVQGTGTHGTPEQAKTKLEGYFDLLTEKLNSNDINEQTISNINSSLESMVSLINLLEEKLWSISRVSDLKDYKDFEYKKSAKVDYGFEKDVKTLADVILKNIPDKSKSFVEINTQVYPKLVEEFNNVYELFTNRKNALDLIYDKNPNNKIKSYKTKHLEQLYSESKTEIDSQYKDLKDKSDEFFHKQAESIKEADNSKTINEVIEKISQINRYFEKYKIIASLINQANEEITKVNSLGESVKNNQNVTESMNLLKEELPRGSSTFYFETNETKLDDNILNLKTYTKRLSLALAIAQELEKLNKFNTNEGQESYLSTEAKKALEEILNEPFKKLKDKSAKETIENYDQLLQNYVNGSNKTSYYVALENSKVLQSNIHKAQEYLNSYKEKLKNNPNYESEEIKKLYENLEKQITEGQNQLKSQLRDEDKKVSISSAIYNSSNGALDLIVKAQMNKVQQEYAKNLALDKYMISNYQNSSVSPRINEYAQNSVEELKTLDAFTPENLTKLNETLVKAQEKFIQQNLAVFKWEANRYNFYKEKFKKYYDFFASDNTDGIAKKDILKVSGINESDLKGFDNAISLKDNNILHIQANEYVQKLDKTDEEIKNWLKTTSNIDVIKTLSEVANEFSNYYQKLISIKSISHILLNINNYQLLKDQFSDNSKSNDNIASILKKIKNNNTELDTKIKAFKEQLNDVLNSNELKNEVDESNISFKESNTSDISSKRDEYFEKYKKVVICLAKEKQKLNDLVFSNSKNNTKTFQKVLHQFIYDSTNYIGRNNIYGILNYLIKSPKNAENLDYKDNLNSVKNEYKKVVETAEEFEKLLLNLSKEKSSDFEIYKILTKAFERVNQLNDWMNKNSNTQLFFEYLNQINNGKANYEDIVPSINTTVEKFTSAIENLNSSNEETLTIDSKNYKAIKLNDQFKNNQNSNLSKLFDKFTILKGNDSIFNTDNLEVFIYKSSGDSNAKYVRSVLTSDPSIKKGFINLYFKFKKPSSITEENSAFWNVKDFGIKFENIAISFKTLDQFVINKENIKDTNALMQPIFTDQEAGWNNLQAPVNLFGAFSKYSSLKALLENKYYFTEDITQDIDAPASGKTNSSSDFRIKVKLDGSYKQYTTRENLIFWKTLNPNFATDKSVKYQNTNEYYNGTISGQNENTHSWSSKWMYKYDSSKDENKNLLFLPIVIGIPVFNNNTKEDAIMIISWQILNRFDKSRTSDSQNISLGSTDNLRYVYFFKRTEAGKSKDSVTGASLSGFYDYVMKKIRIRDLVGLSFEDLNNSGLWGKDQYIEKDETNSGKGGVGDADFYQAIGQNGKFDIKFKLH